MKGYLFKLDLLSRINYLKEWIGVLKDKMKGYLSKWVCWIK